MSEGLSGDLAGVHAAIDPLPMGGETLQQGPPADAPAWKNILERLASETDYVVADKRAIEIVLLDGGYVVFLSNTAGAVCAGVISEPAGPELVSYLRRAFGDLYLPLFAITADGLAELTRPGIEKEKPA